MKRIIIISLMFLFFICAESVFATESALDSIKNEMDLNSLLETLEEYTKDKIDIHKMTEDLISGKGADYGVIGEFVLNAFFEEIKLGIKSMSSILIILVLMAIISSLELEKDNALSTVTSLVGFLIITSIVFESYITMSKIFVDAIMLLTKIVEVVAPFLLAILIATGEIATSGIIGPVLLFVTSLIGVVISYVVMPLLSVSLIFKAVTNMSEKVRLDKLAGMFSSAAMWIVGVVFAIFLAVLELEGSIGTSVDEVALKTTQTAVSNLIPVVGKFVTDSMEVVMGAAEVIGKTVGVVGIIVLVIIVLIPIIKLIIYSFIYFLISCFAEMLNVDKKITQLFEGISKQYKTMIGIMIGSLVTFIISFAIIINLMGKVGA